MKYENVYGPFNLPNCSSIIHLSDIQLYQQEFIPELPLFLRCLHYICLVRYSLYIYFTSEGHTRQAIQCILHNIHKLLCMVTHLSRLAWKETFTQLTNGVSPAESGTTVMALAANVPVGWSPCPGHLSILPWSVGLVIPAWPSSPNPPCWLVESLLTSSLYHPLPSSHCYS